VGLGSQVQDMGDAVLAEDGQNLFLFAEIYFFKSIAGVVCDPAQIGQVTGVGQAIEVDQALQLRVIDEVLNEVKAIKPAPPVTSNLM
jgi:O-phosphoseryl-tRNA(Cys) synthetase